MLDSGHFQETTSITMAEETKLTPLETFAQAISASAKTIATYCRDSGHPQLSDDNSSGLTGDVLPPSAPQAVTAARQTILEASYRLQQLVTEPSQYLPRLTVYVSVEQSPMKDQTNDRKAPAPGCLTLAVPFQNPGAHPRTRHQDIL